MLPPQIGTRGKGAGEGGQQAPVRHLLRTQHRGAAIPQIDTVEKVPVGAAAAQVGCRQQTGFHQPGTGAVRLDDMPGAWIPRGEACRSVAQAIPSTSIIE